MTADLDLLEQSLKLVDEGHFAAALELLERYLQTRPEDPKAVWASGVCLKGLNQSNQALRRFADALQLDQFFKPNVLSLAQLLIELGISEQAVTLLQVYLGQWPDDLDICRLLIRAQEQLLAKGSDLPGLAEMDQVMSRLHRLLSLLLRGHKLRIETLAYHSFGNLLLDLFFLPRLKREGHLKDQIFFCGKPINQAVADLLSREVPVIQDDSFGQWLPVGWNWNSSGFRLDDSAFKKRFFSSRYAPLFDDLVEFFKSTNGDCYCPLEEWIRARDSHWVPQFTEDEEQRGRRYMRDVLGMREGIEHVCIFARDAGYFGEKPDSPNYFRNMDIDNYHLAAKYLLEKEVYVVRMGSKVTKPFCLKHERVIDYAMLQHDDFMDLFLIAKAKFFAGPPSGIEQIARIFNVPQLAVNAANFKNASVGKMYIPKKLRSVSAGEYVPFSKFLPLFWGDQWDGNLWENGVAQRERFGIEYEECSPEEIMEAFAEMWERLEGSFIETEEDRALIARYEQMCLPYVERLGREPPIGTRYLRRNRHLFFSN